MQHKALTALKKIVAKTIIVFKRQQWKEILTFLFFLLLASSFWLLEHLQQGFERKLSLPIHYKDIPATMALADDNTQKITLSVKDKGTKLFYYLWKGNFSPIEVSVNNLKKQTDSTSVLPENMLNKAIMKQLISSTTLLSIEPEELIVKYFPLKEKTVAVDPVLNISYKKGYNIAGKIIISPATVNVFGREDIIDTLRIIQTKQVKLNNLSSNAETTVALDLPEGVKSNVSKVTVGVPVGEFFEKRVKIQVVCNDVPARTVLRFFPTSVTVTCYIPVASTSESQGFSNEDIEIVIPFKSFQQYRSAGKLPVLLTKKPSYVFSYEVSPSELEFSIE